MLQHMKHHSAECVLCGMKFFAGKNKGVVRCMGYHFGKHHVGVTGEERVSMVKKFGESGVRVDPGNARVKIPHNYNFWIPRASSEYRFKSGDDGECDRKQDERNLESEDILEEVEISPLPAVLSPLPDSPISEAFERTLTTFEKALSDFENYTNEVSETPLFLTPLSSSLYKRVLEDFGK